MHSDTFLTRVYCHGPRTLSQKTSFQKQYSPHPYTAPKYGQMTHFAPNVPDESEITADEHNFLEQVLGALL